MEIKNLLSKIDRKKLKKYVKFAVIGILTYNALLLLFGVKHFAGVTNMFYAEYVGVSPLRAALTTFFGLAKTAVLFALLILGAIFAIKLLRKAIAARKEK